MPKGKGFVALVVMALAVLLLAGGCGRGGTQPSASGQQSQAPREKPFYEGQIITFIVSTSPGGGYDAYARLVQPFLQKYLPGSTVIVKNVPGAGQVIGTNELYMAKPDGLTVGIINKGLITGQLAGLEGIKFDLAKMTWLANAAKEPRVVVVKKDSPYKNIEDLKNAKKEIKFGSVGVGTSSHNDTVLLAAILGMKQLKAVPGYPGSSDIDLAIIRGELDGRIGSYDSVRNMIENGEVRPLLVVGSEKIQELPDIPLIRDVAPPENKALIDLMIAQAELSRPIAAPPGLPEDRTKVLREAFAKAFADPDLLAKAKELKLPIEYMSGEETEKIVKQALNQPPEVVKFIKENIKIE